MTKKPTRKLGDLCRAAFTFFVIITFVSGCSSTRPLPDNAGKPGEDIKIGDSLQITTKEGKELKLKVEDVTEDQIYGQGQTVQLDEILKIEKREFNGMKTTGLCLGLTVGGVILLGVLLAGLSGAFALSAAGP